MKKKVLMIGWDAADWQVINPLMDNGLMPTLNKLVNQSTIGDIETLDPPLSPMLWTSIATGKTADKHGILGFLEADDKNEKVTPITIAQRKSKAIWNILNANGYKCNVFNWWPSHPAEPLNGVMVSNFFNQMTGPYNEEWPIRNGAVHPESLTDELKAFRVHGEEINEHLVAPFVPGLLEDIEKLTDRDHKKLGKIRKYLAECVSTHAQVTWAMENTSWDFTAVYFDAIDQFCHSFMNFMAPKMDKIREEEFEKYQYVVNAIYVFHDMMLERLLNLAGEDTTVILLSDHGFYSGDMRPKSIPKHHASIALQHNPLGMFLMKGAGIKKDERIFGANLLDVVPTLLAHLNLPIGKDMDGKVLNHCFEQQPNLSFIPSWENMEGNFGTHKKVDNSMDEAEVDIAIQQLKELGYVEDSKNGKEQFQKTSFDTKYHLSVVLSSTGREREALEILEELYSKDKVDVRVNLALIQLYCDVKEPKKAREVLSLFKNINKEKLVNFDMLEVKILQAEQNHKETINLLKEFYAKRKTLNVAVELGDTHRVLKQYDEALVCYQDALKFNPNSFQALHGLGICQIKLGDFEEAANNCLSAIGVHFDAPACHFHLGEALVGLGLFEDACRALETSLFLNPKTNRARKLIINVYENELKDYEKAKLHKKIFEEQTSDEIIVVSGLPRSGTSMMMQMLEAGGVSIFTDEIREKDASNPRGYYELEAVKRISKDNAWLENAKGKAIKIVSPLLQYLKLSYRYKVISMERDLDEVMSSQHKMKQRLKGIEVDEKPLYDVKLANVFKKQKEKIDRWEKENMNIDMLHVSYQDVIQNKSAEIKRIEQFLGVSLNTSAMEKVVDAKLYRERKRSTSP